MRFLKYILAIIIVFVLFKSNVSNVYGIHDPLSTPNNRIGIHILFTSELADAAKLVNSSNGDWGYITIPIQVSDKDLVKWQIFMDQAKKNHLIPILRLATNGDYFNTSVWHKPNEADILDFANFLNSLTWPIENKYVIVFNEVNRGDEWEGSPNPEEYAKLLSYAVSVFKSKDPNFFIISAGLDNAAPNQQGKYIDQFDFYRQMNNAVPGIFNQIDGFSSHSYPNPGFKQPPTVLTNKSILSFKYEKEYLQTMTNKNLLIFITETGWSTNSISDEESASYYKEAFSSIWNDPNIIAVTPFILSAGTPPFSQFSLINVNGSTSKRYEAIKKLPKTKGEPVLTNIKSVLGDTILNYVLPIKNFSKYEVNYDINGKNKGNAAKEFLKWLLNVR
jgi:hypothetical protein